MKGITQRHKVLVGGILSLILLVGVARFAYTPLLPLMLEQTSLGYGAGGWLATINYTGYIFGALIAALVNSITVKDILYRASLILAVVTTAMMAFSDHVIIWAVSRFVAGLTSAGGLLLASALILHWLMRQNFRGELGVHFAGVGIGIAVMATGVWGMSLLNWAWDVQWWGMTVLAFVLAIPAWLWVPHPEVTDMTSHGKTLVDTPPSQLFSRVFLVSYTCAGVGYVISATFIVAIIEELPGLQGLGNVAFLLLGLGAAPAPFIWDRIVRGVGFIPAQIMAYFGQIPAVLLPLISTHPLLVVMSTAIFGFCFIGCVSLTLTMAGLYYPTKPAKMMGRMTLGYGIAQILAPAITGYIAQTSGSYTSGLVIAAAAMSIGTGLMIWLMTIPGPTLQNS